MKRKTNGGRRACGGMYLVVQSSYLLLTGCGEQEGIHLGLQCVIHLHINVIACSLLLVIRIHAVNITVMSCLRYK